MNRILTGYQVSSHPELIRYIIGALLVSALLFPPSLAMSGDKGAGYSLFVGSASFQLATKAPVNVSTTPVVFATQVHTVQTAVRTTVATPVPVYTPQGTPVTPLPRLTGVPMFTFVPSIKPVKSPDIAVVTPRPFTTTQRPFVTMTQGALPRYCLSPLSMCGGTCTDTRTNSSNCGYCGQRCDADQHCSGGRCVVSCPSGEANLYTDNNNCGSCGHQCGAGTVCYNKVCVAGIDPSWHDCGNGWVSFNSDYHCGGCFNQCPSGSHCSNGTCLLPCGNTLVDTGSDPNNCGSCGHACPYGICCSGHCVNWDEFDANCGECGKACQDGRTCMYGPDVYECLYHCQLPDGREYWIYHLNRDTDCGACGNVCAGGTHCSSGRCMLNCTEDSVLCPDNTCVPRSTRNCAFCGNACLPGETCTNGHCTCPEGYKVCGDACVELGTRSHCGVDCQPCPEGYECKKYQQWGTCVHDCPYGYLSCGDGSCKNVQIDTANCGSCWHACTAGQYCVNGTCLSSCPAGTTDCQNDGTCNNPLIDPHNCGGCGTSCSGQQVCANGVCSNDCPDVPNIGECIYYNTDIGGLACADRRTDNRNCGVCGHECNLHQNCVDGSCVETCPEGTQYCDEGGCTYTRSDIHNCGTCGYHCGLACFGGSCWPW